MELRSMMIIMGFIGEFPRCEEFKRLVRKNSLDRGNCRYNDTSHISHK